MAVCPPVALSGQVCYIDGMKQKRAIFYIDGFNFYYLALKAKPQYKWLNPKALADGIVHDDTTVACVKYFSAPVSAKISQSAHKNQNVYLRALRTIPAIDIILGKFVVREKFVTLTPEEQHNLNRIKVIASIAEEKRTDVNLASHLIYDACNDNFDIAYVITNDTDFVEPIRMVKEIIGKPIVIVAPRALLVREKKNKFESQLPDSKLKKAASETYFINDSLLGDSQFPDEIHKKNGKIIRKPQNWWKK
ncbi:MAG: NYN domain-containing protein [Candidatus Halichondribacter symbioticus]